MRLVRPFHYYIQPLIDYGHIHFGENKVQEASSKWLATKKLPNLRLHMVGKLQSNKQKMQSKFSTIFTHWTIKNFLMFYKNEKSNKNLNYFIQVNMEMKYKNLESISELDGFYSSLKKKFKYNRINGSAT